MLKKQLRRQLRRRMSQPSLEIVCSYVFTTFTILISVYWKVKIHILYDEIYHNKFVDTFFFCFQHYCFLQKAFSMS